MIHADISIYPIGTEDTSASFYIAKAIEVIQKMDGIKYQITPMGTILESDNIDNILTAVKEISETVHNLGIKRTELILKIDSRKDKEKTLQEKVESVNRYLTQTK